MAANMDNAPAPRLCHVIRWTDFDGYGFNLHSDKTRNGQFIGKVDLNSPAEAAGLKQGDRIVEVNGINIANENHKQVVERIKAIPKETRLLVVDSETDAWYKSNKVVVRGTQKNVIYLQNPATSDAKSSPDKDAEVEKAPPSPVFTPEIHSETVISNRKSSIEPPSQSEADGRFASSAEDPRRRSTLDDERIQEVETENNVSRTSGASPLEDKLAHQEKRSSITSSEHAPVAPIVAASDDHKKHHHENGHHQSHAHRGKSGHGHDHARHAKDEHDHHEKTHHSHDHTHRVHEHSAAEAYTHEHNFHREPSDVSNGDDMKETIHETRIISDGNEADRLASQLTGYRVLGEDIEVHPSPHNESAPHGDRRPSALADGSRAHNEHVHFENGAEPKHVNGITEDNNVPLPRIWGATYEPSPVMQRKEILEERVVHSPAFSPSTPVSEKEEVSEKVEVRKQNGSTRNYSYNIEPNKDSLSDDSGSRSFSSAEAHSDKENGHRLHADDISDEHESKTPSPSPAVVAAPVQTTRSPAPVVRSTENGTVKPISEKEKPFEKPPASTQKTSNYGNLALGVSVQEMRATLSRKKKPDPRNQQMDLRKKHDFINNM